MNKFFKESRIGKPEQTITKRDTSGARIKALICLNANTPNNNKAINNTKIPKFITKIAPLRLYYFFKSTIQGVGIHLVKIN